jgi:hypothetical protein
MKIKEFGLSIVLNAFLGYLWILFIEHIVSIANSMDNVFIIGGIVIIIGSTLFMEIVKRVTPFNQYKFTHPVKLTGFVSFGLVVIVHVFIVNII